ncbi:Uncharacterized protein M6B38_222835 [Iris pallida]|uniref:Uncharacterized protein n=1 Tax=Iris pallida TaxID=29817 RepID=A0AAX6DX04_IRIPA|nr:Uncharacterized protein M6B38_233820 [Iris pallida]KAJ6796357.1 Uncharacterized protein M6B38_222835 [Iris pallida]
MVLLGLGSERAHIRSGNHVDGVTHCQHPSAEPLLEAQFQLNTAATTANQVIPQSQGQISSPFLLLFQCLFSYNFKFNGNLGAQFGDYMSNMFVVTISIFVMIW